MSDQDDMLIEECKQECKQENIHAEKVWMNSDEEKQLAAILDETKGWKKLIDCLNFDYLLKTFEQSSSNPSLLLLNYIAVRFFIFYQMFLYVISYFNKINNDIIYRYFFTGTN
jgi:hypothetical protein